MKEALKLALEALKAADWYIDQLEMVVYCVDDEGTHENRAKVQAAITTIKEALAQPEQEQSGFFSREAMRAHSDCPDYTTPPKRQPLTDDEINKCDMCGYVGKDKDSIGQCPKCRWDELRPLVEKARQKPLTDDQIYDMYNEPRSDAEMLEFARAIEAALGIKE